jgi:hypothetical protein
LPHMVTSSGLSVNTSMAPLSASAVPITVPESEPPKLSLSGTQAVAFRRAKARLTLASTRTCRDVYGTQSNAGRVRPIAGVGAIDACQVTLRVAKGVCGGVVSYPIVKLACW